MNGFFILLSQANRRGTLMGGAFLVVLLIVATAAILFPMRKAQHAPRLLFVMDGKAVDLPLQAQARIIAQIEGIVRSTNCTSDQNPDLRGNQKLVSPEDMEKSGRYFRISYTHPQSFSTRWLQVLASNVKEVYLGVSKQGIRPAEGAGVITVAANGHVTQLTMYEGTLLDGLALNPDVFPHLPDKMRTAMSNEVNSYLQEVNGWAFKLDSNVWLSPELKLLTSVEEGDLPGLKRQLDAGNDLRRIPIDEPTLLAQSGSPEVAEFLVQHGVNANAINNDGDTALFKVRRNKNPETVAPIVRVLLKHGANPNARDKDGWTPLMLVRDGATAEALVEAGADVNAKSGDGEGLLDMLDLGPRDLLYYQVLVAHCVPIGKNANGTRLLAYATYHDQADIVAWLLARGVDPNLAGAEAGVCPDSPNGEKPLTKAAAGGAPNAAKVLIDHGAKIDDEAMNRAIDFDRSQVIKVFWQSGARNISEILYDVSQNAPVEKMEALLTKGAAADPPQDQHMTPLALAARDGNLAAVQVLLEHGADPNRKGIEGAPLILAAVAGHENVVDYLLQKGAHPDADTVKATLAVFNHSRTGEMPYETGCKIIQDLVDAGAFRNLHRDQMTDVLLSKEGGDWYDLDIIKILLRGGLDPTGKNAGGKSAIDIVQARCDQSSDARTRAHLLDLIMLLKNVPAHSTEKNDDNPKLLFVMDGRPIDLPPRAQVKIIGQMESIIHSIDATSDQNPGRFKNASYDLSPKVLKENGSYFQIAYPQEKMFSTLAGPVKAKDFYIGIVPYANVPGVPGGLFLVGADNHIINISCHGNLMDETADIALDSEVYPHLPENMRRSVASGFFDFLDRAREENLSPELKLARAVKNGDLPEVKSLLAAGVSVGEILPGQSTLLFAAGSPEAAEFLIEQGVKVDAQNEQGETALWSICYNNNWRRPQNKVAPIVRSLLKHGANPNASSGSSWPPLMVARDAATVDALVEYGADVHAKINGHGILDELDIGYREAPYYQALAAHGLAIDNHDNGIHLLNHAAYQGQLDIVNWLLDRGVDPNGIDPISGSYDGFARKPLTEAARLDQAAVAQALIEHGAKIDDDAVNCALRYGRTRILKVFRDGGASQFSELYYAVTQKAPIEKLAALLQKGIPADPPQDKHATPLAVAAGQGNLPVVQLLIDHGADPNRKLERNSGDRQFDFAEWTPLATAASGGHEAVVSYLLQNGAHPDTDTLKLALYCFYHRGQAAPSDETYHWIIQQLVDAGACKNVPREQMADLLLWRGDGAGDWCDLPMLKILLAAGLDPTAKNAVDMNAIDLVQARYDKIADAQSRDHLSKEIDLLKNFKTETDNKK